MKAGRLCSAPSSKKLSPGVVPLPLGGRYLKKIKVPKSTNMQRMMGRAIASSTKLQYCWLGDPGAVTSSLFVK
jgi:hypothetical protein